MRLHMFQMCALAVFAGIFADACNSAEPDPASSLDRTIVVRAAKLSLTQRPEQEFRSDVEKWCRSPAYLHAGLSHTLLNELAGSSGFLGRAPGDGATLATVGQRALWALEQLTGCSMPMEQARQEPQSGDWRRQAVAIVEAYYKGEFDAAARMSATQPSPVKAGEYEGKIQTGQTAARARQSCAAMAELLERWHPIGRRMLDLEGIIGVKGVEANGRSVYMFDQGRVGWSFEFEVQDGLIKAVWFVGSN